MSEIFYWQNQTPSKGDEPFITRLAGHTYGRDYKMTRKNSKECICAYVLKGRGTLVYNGLTYNFMAGDAFLLPMQSDHVYYSDPLDPLSFLWFNCTGTLVPLLLQGYHLEQRVIIPQYSDPRLFREFHRLCQTHRDPDELHPLCALQFHRIVAAFAAHLARTEQSPARPLSYQIKRYLDEHLNQAFSLKDVAQDAGYSPAYIGRCFKAAYGQTPYQYLLNEKLTAAEKLLSRTNMNVREVAALFGFHDEFHFSNTFYRRFGVRPTGVRQKNGKK